MTNGLIIAMNANYQQLCLKANQDLGKFFDCPVNSKYHLRLVVEPWLKNNLMNDLCEQIETKSTRELENEVRWINNNLAEIAGVIVNRLFKV
jgi:hypothetical protein